jgi:uncharacterized protein DUF4326
MAFCALHSKFFPDTVPCPYCRLKPRGLGVTTLATATIYTLPDAGNLVINQKNRPHSNTEIVYIGRPSVFGNPYRIGVDGTRIEVIQKYELWVRDRIEYDGRFREAVKGLHGKLLSCWCRPLPCHGDVLVKIAEELNT